MEKRNLLIEHRDLILILITYSSLAIFSLNYQQYNLGADGISYLSIALKYVQGDWSNAINGYWSPLYSWLITPIIFFGYNTSYATHVTRIVSFIAGFFTIIGLSQLSSTFNLNKNVEMVLLATSIPMILFYAISCDTPDLLVVCLLVYYFSIIFKENYSHKWINGVLCGFLGAMAFFDKTYMFPFFLVHFIFFNFLYYFKGLKKDKKGIKRNLILGLIVFLALSGIWIGNISMKYDKLTIGTTTEYNHAIIGPEYQNHPIFFMGLIKPPNNSATSTWEEPSLVKLNDWSMFESMEYFKFQLKLIQENLFKTVIIIEYHSTLSLLIIIIILYLIFKSGTGKFFKTRLICLIITIFIYSSGYLLIHIQERYLWPVTILLMVSSFYLISNLYQNKTISLQLRNVFLVILMFSFIFTPVNELFNYSYTEPDSYLLKTLKNDYQIHGNIASNSFWEQTNEISFYLNSHYYGMPKNNYNSTELENELKANDIDYYFIWGDSDIVDLMEYEEITNGKIKRLKIYSKTCKII